MMGCYFELQLFIFAAATNATAPPAHLPTSIRINSKALNNYLSHQHTISLAPQHRLSAMLFSLVRLTTLSTSSPVSANN
jgi:hypothetical protein